MTYVYRGEHALNQISLSISPVETIYGISTYLPRQMFDNLDSGAIGSKDLLGIIEILIGLSAFPCPKVLLEDNAIHLNGVNI